MRTPGVVTSLLLALLALAGCGGRQPRHVVLVTFDGLRADHLPLFGYPRDTAPNVTRLGREGMVFDRVIPSGCGTKTSLASLFTGLGYSGHGLFTPRDVLSEDHLTVAEWFSVHGYETAGFVGTPHAGSEFQFDQGFDTYSDTVYRIDELGPLVLEFLSSRSDDAKPLFLYVHLKEPHPPWWTESPWLTAESVQKRPFGEGCGYIPSREALEALDESKLADWIAQYDGAIHAADAFVGELVEVLEEQGMLAESVLGFGTDHGYELLDRYAFTHGRSPFEEVTRSFFVLWSGGGGLESGARSSAQGRIFDIGPTLMGLVGLEVPSSMEGVDLVGAPESLPEVAFTHCRNAEVARRGDLKLVRLDNPGRKPMPPGLDVGFHLFDLAADPLETTDASERHRSAFERLRLALVEQARLVEQISERVELEDDEMEPEILEQLKALGYIEGDG